MRRCGVVRTVINNMTFDGATTAPMQQPVRDALIGFLTATAQCLAEATKKAKRGGIALGEGQGRRHQLSRMGAQP